MVFFAVLCQKLVIFYLILSIERLVINFQVIVFLQIYILQVKHELCVLNVL
jgi:hypothetical protein